ncbi:MAG TPA: FAD-dependent oxidoreductase, partial [Opitutaceae bacterium]|nr:FAD-dependent oxidoreductase [Opitutaceae bacterium]
MNSSHVPAKAKDLPHIVVLGAGFAGLAFCKSFDSRRARVTVIDRQNHHLFQPLLYQVATAGLSAVDIAAPVRSILRKKKNLTVLMRTVTAVDLVAKTLTHDGGTLAFDYLVIGTGGATSYLGRPEWERFAPGLKTLNDALLIRHRVLTAFEKAESESDPVKQSILTTIIVIGAGPTGVELAGTFAELTRTSLNRDF